MQSLLSAASCNVNTTASNAASRLNEVFLGLAKGFHVNLRMCRRRTTAAFLSCLILILVAMTSLGQNSKMVQTGVVSGQPYASSDFENISLTNGNVALNFPMASLKGRGQTGFSFAIRYDSKIWRTITNPVYNQFYQPNPTYQNFMATNPDGGWKVGTGYKLDLIDRTSTMDIAPGDPCAQGVQWLRAYKWRLELNTPDGQKIEFRPVGYSDVQFGTGNGGYFPVRPDGRVMTITGNCVISESQPSNTHMTYYSSDGSGMRLIYSNGEALGYEWELSMPDGSRVIQPVGGGQKIIDRNGNYVESATVTLPDSTQLPGWRDEVGHYIAYQLNYATNEDRYYQLGVNGALLMWKVKWKTVYVRRNYKTSCSSGCPGTQQGPVTSQQATGTFKVVDRIDLPDQLGGLSYVFTYHAKDVSNSQLSSGWGEVKSITTPGGAAVSYGYKLSALPEDYTPFQDLSHPANSVVDWAGRITKKKVNHTETYDGSSNAVTDVWSYAIDHVASTVTAPDGSVTTQSYWDIVEDAKFGGQVYKEVKPDGTIIERVWANNYPTGFTYGTGNHLNAFVKTEFTTIPDANGSPSLTAIKDYNFDKNGNPTSVSDYDFIPANSSAILRDSNGIVTGFSGLTPARTTATEYYYPTPSWDSTSTSPNTYFSYGSPNLRALAASSEVRDGSGTPFSRTEIVYDNTSSPTNGNPTSTTVWDSFKGGVQRAYSNPLTSTNSISTSATYNAYGMPLTTTDANGNVTRITYGNVTGPNGVVTDLYPTQTTKAYGTSVEQTFAASYDFYTGLVTTVTDVDNNVSTVTEYDDIGRPTKVRTAAGTGLEAQTVTQYHDTDRFVVVKSDLETLGDGKKVATQFFDDLGRVRLTTTLEDVSTQDPTNEQHGIKVQTRYKYASGYRYTLTSNPFRAATSGNASSEETMGWTRSTATSTGRHSEAETFAGASLPSPWGSNFSTTGKVQTDIDANATTVTDQAGKVRRSLMNGLGQLIRVDEPDGSNALGTVSNPNQPTYYTYNTLGSMVRVQQGSQNRYFMYSSLGRMLRFSQPEQETNTSLDTSGNPDNNSWTGGANYDSNGNVLTTTDAKDKTITSTYDALNRPLTRSYSDGITPTVTNTYDDPTIAFSKGKLTKVSNSVSETRYTGFDVLGRSTETKQVTGSNTYITSYTYGLTALTQMTYPDGRTVSMTYDADGDIGTITGVPYGGSSKTYANNFSYTADKKIKQLKLGNNLWETASINARLQVTEFDLGTTQGGYDKWKAQYEYGELQTNGTVDTTKNAGNIAKQTVSFSGLSNPFVQAYKYDSLDRLTEAKESVNGMQTWVQNWGYDRYGNRSSFTQNILGNTGVSAPSISSSTNRYNSSQGYTFDKNGNITADVDPMTTHSRSFTFDGDNKQTQVTDTTTSTVKGTYSYDGEGKRVKKVDTATTIFVYANGQLLEERNSSNVVTTAYIYAGSQLLATETSSATNYTATDQLGSPRVITNGSGSIVARRDFLPFGEELYADGTYRKTTDGYTTTGSDAVRQRFTGYQRDLETGLDFAEARYYDNTHARFTAVDPLMASGKSADPQTFNRYAYTGNNPINANDPTGLDWWDVTNNSTHERSIQWFDDDPDESEYSVAGRWTQYVYKADDGMYYALDPNSSDREGFYDENAAMLRYGRYTGFSDLDYFPCNAVGCGDLASMVANMRTGNPDGAIYDFGKISVEYGVGEGIGRYLAPVGDEISHLVAGEAESASAAMIPKAASSLGKWGEAQLGNALGGAVKNTRPLQTSLGNRVNDFIVDGVAYEAKAGVNVGLTTSVRTQILKDAELITKNQIRGAEWHFYQGAQQEVLDFLAKNGIKSVVH